MKAFVIQRYFPKYRQHIFDRLAQEWDFKLLHGPNGSSLAPASATYARQLPFWIPFKKKSIIFLFSSFLILKERPQVVIHESGLGILSMWFTLMICKVLNTKFVLWGHGYNMKLGFYPKHQIDSKLRLRIARWSDAYLFYTEEGKKVLEPYLKEEKLFVAQNTTDTSKNLKVLKSLQTKHVSLAGRESFRLVYLGRLVPDKKPLMLLDIYRYVSKKIDPPLELHIIGTGPLLNTMKNEAESENLPFVFHDELYDPVDFGPILFHSDLLVNPGYVGLSILDAFTFELPIITFEQQENGPFHSPEITYLDHGNTGIILSEHSIEAMGDAIIKFLLEHDRTHYTRHIRELLKKTNTETMAAGFFNCADKITGR